MNSPIQRPLPASCLPRHSRIRAQRGFTLLEVMLAFVVLAVALGLLLGMLSRGLKQVTQSQAETEAALHAQSLLDALGTLEPLQPGTRDGEFEHGRYRWRLQVAQAQDPAPPPPPQEGAPAPQPVATDGAPLLYRVLLDVEWGAATPAQKLRFETLRLRAPPANASAAPAAADEGSADAPRPGQGAVR
jgi:general secretion pathway protein I